MWLPPSAVACVIPGFVMYEERRPNGSWVGIAKLVRKGIKVSKVRGTEYAQAM